MVRTVITKQQLSGSYPPTALTFTFVNGDNTNGMQFPAAGKEIVILHNTTGGSINVTLGSAPLYGRTGDLVKALPAGAYAVIPPLELAGWRQTDKNIYLNFSATGVDVAVLALA